MYDEAMFMWHDEGKLVGLFNSHVEDFVYCGTAQWHVKIIDPLFTTFRIRESHCGSFKYIGLNVVKYRLNWFYLQKPGE